MSLFGNDNIYGYDPQEMCGVSNNFRDENVQPLNGLRHRDESGHSGWYIWRGEYEHGADFFQPVHISHILDTVSAKLLKLAPGMRFLVDTNSEYIDVWNDPSLLDINDIKKSSDIS